MLARKVLVALVICILLMTACQPAPAAEQADPLTAALSELEGGVGIKAEGAADFAPAQAGMSLAVNGSVRTESDGRARLDLSSGTIVRVAPSSVFTLVSNDQQPDSSLATKIKMELGQIFIVLNGGAMDVETPSGQASVRGSYLMVFIDPNTLDVYLTCLEGDCGAGNEGGDIKFITGQSVRLMHGKPGDKPIPPIFNLMNDADIAEWLKYVPEAKKIWEIISATLTAYPTRTSTPSATPTFTATSTPTPTALPCVTLLTPADGAILKAIGKEVFTWSEFPGAVKYQVKFKDPKGTILTFNRPNAEMPLYVENIPLGGAYSWYVIPINANDQPLCESEVFTFSKPESPTATPTARAGGTTDPNPMAFTGDRTIESPTCVASFYIFVTDADGVNSVTVYWKDSFGVGGSAAMKSSGNNLWYAGVPLSGYPNSGTLSYGYVGRDALGFTGSSGGYSLTLGGPCP